MARNQIDPPLEPLERLLEKANAQAIEAKDYQPTVDIEAIDLSTEDALSLIGKLTPVAAASLEYVLRNPTKFPTQAVAAAKIVLERKLGAVPDTVIQNNMQFIVKWED